MAILNKLITALRGGINDVGESIVDSQALRILDQEIRDADAELKQAKESLANIMAQQKLADKQVAEIKTKIAEYEGYAIKALENNNDDLALEVAEKIAKLENDLTNQQKQATSFADSVSSLRQTISQTEINIRNLKQQVDIVKATESVQKAQTAISQRYGGSTAKLQTALDSLDRIKKRQDKTAAKIEAKNELAMAENNDELEAKLEAAGIKNDSSKANAILAKLKDKQNLQK
ncbi:PspA/IM30 family protein [Frischella perrara]|uniref:Phage shock protein A n=1 Tax=Frischella perrara TaxID=1267021 RepID=A0A0A7RXC7_FRIPE|nr:PspA/IM30 family protein [Frischella perrara]AJA43878.1 phage shock protein A (PspA) family protein [Frischella perrara]MCT6875142.1 PspA/IM30 family protein [Frischella perrara]PWV61973.1 phage shock protein A (PspA) family protein [Frischella perrara]PXY96880.1 phage shock protein A [Frischella perrara]